MRSADQEWIRTLLLFRTADSERFDIGRFFSPPEITGEIRSDLHPRWSRDGEKVCFDSAHEGTRQMHVADVSEIVSLQGLCGLSKDIITLKAKNAVSTKNLISHSSRKGAVRRTQLCFFIFTCGLSQSSCRSSPRSALSPHPCATALGMTIPLT